MPSTALYHVLPTIIKCCRNFKHKTYATLESLLPDHHPKLAYFSSSESSFAHTDDVFSDDVSDEGEGRARRGPLYIHVFTALSTKENAVECQ